MLVEQSHEQMWLFVFFTHFLLLSMAFVPKNNGEWKLRFFAKKASTALTNGGAVIQDTTDSGRITVAGTGTTFVAGILKVSASSGDATNTPVPYLVPMHAAPVVIADVSAALTPGTEYDFAAGGASINQGATSNKPFLATKSISSSKAEGILKFTR